MADDATVDFVLDGKPHTLRYVDSTHRYYLDGKPAVSVSTYAKVTYSDPSGLMGYARNEALAGRDHKETTKIAQECGNAAHAQLEALITTEQPLDLNGQPERVRGALQAVAKWYLDYDPTFVASEVIVCSPEIRCAGRFDFLCEIGGELVLGDLKSTDAGKGWDHFRRYKAKAAFAQLAGYGICYRAMYPDKPQPTGRYILRVGADGTYDFERDGAPELSERSFLSKVRTYRDEAEWDKADKSADKQQTRLEAA